jgi:hypothetical protein
MATRIPFPAPPASDPYRYHGRNRYAHCAGLELVHYPTSARVRLYPLTSRGQSTDACMIEMPVTGAVALAQAILGEHAPHLLTPPQS